MKVKSFCCSPTEIDDKLNKWLKENAKSKILKIISPTIVSNDVALVCIMVFYNEYKQVNIPNVSPDQSHRCPNCDSIMMVRANSNTGDLFWGCSKFPNCRGMRPWEEGDWELVTDGKDPGPSPKPGPNNDDIPF